MGNNFVSESTVAIMAPAAKVWEALTTPALIKQYLFDTDVTTDWKVGSPVSYKGVWEGKPYEDKGVILKFEPNQLLETTYWSSHFGPDVPENYQTIDYKLTSEGDQMTLTITTDHNSTQESSNQSAANWNMVLQSLKKLVEQ